MSYIKKIKLSNVEEFLRIKLKRNFISIGADTASYHTAFAIIRTTDSYLILESLEKIEVPKLSKKDKMEKVLTNIDLYTEQLDDLKNKWSQKYKFDEAQIEDCYYRFSIQTTKLLAYNGILTYDRLKRISKFATLIMPGSARARIKFKKSGKKVSRNDLKKQIINYINIALDIQLVFEENDQVDAIVLALSGLAKEGVRK